MKTVRLSGDGGSIELEQAEFGPSEAPADEDLLLNVTVHAHGYSAADQVWVVCSDWRAFLMQLSELERSRRGSAGCGGASPEDLALEIFSTDGVGHVAIRGHLGRTTSSGHRLRLEFSFAFEPDRLPHLLAELRAFGVPSSTSA